MQETKFIAWPDTHLPHEDKDAVRCALKILEWYKPHTVVILGDFIDFESVSHWMKDKHKSNEGLRLADDYKAGNELLDKITKHCKRLVYITGNHERFLDDACERNPELIGTIELDKGLKFEERRKKGLEIIYKPKYGDCYNIGKLWFTHGSYLGQHPAMTHVNNYERSIVMGHSHKVEIYTKINPIDVEDKHIGVNLGCLAKMNPGYMQGKPNSWVHCLGIGLVRSNRDFNIDPVIISRGVASYGGLTFGK